MFYAPCQAKNPNNSFFRDYNEPGRDLLDPLVWIKNAVVSAPEPIVRESPGIDGPQEIDFLKVQRATELWRQSIQHPEEGNDRFFQYAVDLRAAGMDSYGIGATLRAEARHGLHPGERRAQINSIMDSLSKSKKKTRFKVYSQTNIEPTLLVCAGGESKWC